MTVKSVQARDVFDAGGRGLQHHGLRRSNTRAVLTLIGFNAGASNAEIARLSGLAPQTVSAILADLDEAGLIERGPVLRGRRGQPATPISLRPNGAFALGVDIGWRSVEIVLLDLASTVRSTKRWDYDYPDATSIVKDIGAAVDDLTDSMPETQRARLDCLGVAVPRDIGAGLPWADAPEAQHSLWAGLDIAGALARRTGLNVTRFNDGNAACWAELIAFERPRPANFVYFLVSHQIGAGIVGEGTLWEGPSGHSANLGAMLVRHGDGPLQPAHFIASVWALERRLTEAGFLFIPGQFETWDWDAFEPVIAEWISHSANILARVAYNTTMVIETGLMVIDTVLPKTIAERLVARVQIEFTRLPAQGFKAPQVRSGHLGGLAPAVGAAELMLYRRFFSRSLADLVG